jgi:hypothetical protein
MTTRNKHSYEPVAREIARAHRVRAEARMSPTSPVSSASPRRLAATSQSSRAWALRLIP